MKTTFVLLILLSLTACQMQALPPYLMQANRTVYDQLNSDAYLKHKIAVGQIVYEGDERQFASAFTHAGTALSDSLAIGGYLADKNQAHYTINANIKDVKFPRCFFGSCETGSSIYYTLTDNKTGKPVYDELLVVPYTGEYNIFNSDMVAVQKEMFGGAIGENFAHLLHVLNNKSKKDL